MNFSLIFFGQAIVAKYYMWSASAKLVWKHQSFEILQELQVSKYLNCTKVSEEKEEKWLQLFNLSDWFWDKLQQVMLVWLLLCPNSFLHSENIHFETSKKKNQKKPQIMRLPAVTTRKSTIIWQTNFSRYTTLISNG